MYICSKCVDGSLCYCNCVGKRSSTEPSPGSDEKSRSRKQKKTNPVANESEAAAIVHSKDSTGSQEIEDESVS